MKLNRVTSVWKRLFFIHNTSKIRKALMEYLNDEGIKNNIENGSVAVEVDNRYYVITFETLNNFTKCEIVNTIVDEDYNNLAVENKAYIADKANIESENDSTVYCFDEEISVRTYFYFTNKNMMLELFANHFENIVKATRTTNEIAYNIIQENKLRPQKPIGFCHQEKENTNNDDQRISAKHEQ